MQGLFRWSIQLAPRRYMGQYGPDWVLCYWYPFPESKKIRNKFNEEQQDEYWFRGNDRRKPRPWPKYADENHQVQQEMFQFWTTYVIYSLTLSSITILLLMHRKKELEGFPIHFRGTHTIFERVTLHLDTTINSPKPYPVSVPLLANHSQKNSDL